MNAHEFVSAIRSVVMNAAVVDTVTTAQKPPGRRPSPDLVELSTWYKGLEDSDRAMLKRMLAIAVHNTMFGFFAVLDGARKADPTAGPGDYFELRHVHGTSEDVLSGPEADPLHELI
jgi:hypothetical protein